MSSVLVSATDIYATLSMADAIPAVRDAFIGLARSEFEMPARTVLGNGEFLVMSARHEVTGSAIVKALSLNFDRSPAICGTLLWSELSRVEQLAADADAVTTLRTGAIVGVATNLLAPADASHLVLIGAGAQATDQVRAVHAVRPLARLTVVDRKISRADDLVRSLAAELADTAVSTASSVEAAISAADIICCATNATRPLFRADTLPERVHVNAIGSFRPDMRELPDELLAEATVIVDDRRAALSESGEIIHAVKAGMLSAESLVELGAALAGPKPPAGPRTVFKTVGLAVQDWAIARLLAAKFLD